MSEFSNIPSLKLLRSVQLFTRLTVLQLSQLADSLVEVSFADGQVIVDKVYCLKIGFFNEMETFIDSLHHIREIKSQKSSLPTSASAMHTAKKKHIGMLFCKLMGSLNSY